MLENHQRTLHQVIKRITLRKQTGFQRLDHRIERLADQLRIDKPTNRSQFLAMDRLLHFYHIR